jgi:hypothetical protein
MARSKKPSSPEPEPPQVPAVQGIKLLNSQIAKAQELLQNRPLSENEYSRWELLTRNYLEKAFGRHSPNINSVMEVGKDGMFPGHANDEWWEEHRAGSLETQIHALQGLRELLQTELQLSEGETTTLPLNDEPAVRFSLFMVMTTARCMKRHASSKDSSRR